MSTPRLAVVGHPNKGKSSIVATLAQDVSVRIGREPGTTTETRLYPMRVDGRTLYELADTPGFQRARRALAWMQAHETDAAGHSAVVQGFLAAHADSAEFRDECELLRPLVEGAGILYVVDGSKPYGPEYEPEMEILRWTGRPRLAVVNPIGGEDYVDQWRAALSQYFGVVRVFDPMTADFTKQLELLRAFGQLDESWTAPFDEACRILETDRRERHRLAARVTAQMLAGALALTLTRELDAQADLDQAKRRLETRYLDRLRQMESEARVQVERVYEHQGLERREAAVELLDTDLFAQETWLLWGLTPTQLLMTGAIGGALTGGGIDLAVGGASLMLGSVIGAAVGATAAWLGSERVAEVKVAGVVPLGGKRLRAGPSRNPNLPYVLLGRALHHQTLIALRTHATRTPLQVDGTLAGPSWLERVTAEERRELERCFTRLRGQSEDALEELAGRLEPHFRVVDTLGAAPSAAGSSERTAPGSQPRP